MLSKKQRNCLKNGKEKGKSKLIVFYPGRFQPFHRGHWSVLKQLFKSYHKVVIGIGSSQESRTKRNPFKYTERKTMIELTLKYYAVNKKKYSIVPIPDFPSDDEWVRYCLKNFRFDVVVTGSIWVMKSFKGKKPIKRVNFLKRDLYRATLIRKMILNNDVKWKKLVPKPVVNYLQQINVYDILLRSSNRKKKP